MMPSRKAILVLTGAGLLYGLLPAPARTPTRAGDAPDYPGAVWAPAAPTNFRAADRPRDSPIDTVVIHDIEGTAMGAVLWFQDPRSQVSAHYVVDATEGKVWQQVREKDIGWHAGNRFVNARSVGIEHEGYAYRPGFYTPALYEASARLVRAITGRYNIPRDRQHIIGHHEVPHPSDPARLGGGSGHTDPGPYWDWDGYMARVRNDARVAAATFPKTIRPGERLEATVTLANTGDDAWPAQARPVRNPELEARDPVFLATASERASVFFGVGWVSPLYAAAPVGGETAPGAAATFRLTLTGPLALGPVEETFRLAKVPVMPRTPIPFGPTVTARLVVEPWEVVWNGASPGFAALYWNRNPAPGGPVWWQKKPAQPAAWTGTLPVGGAWDVYARWTPGPSRTARAVYEIQTADGLKSVTVDQRKGGKGTWHRLGRFRFADPRAVRVTLRGEGSGIVVADGVRFVGPFPAYSRTEEKP